jgi:hypothetical protein
VSNADTPRQTAHLFDLVDPGTGIENTAVVAAEKGVAEKQCHGKRQSGTPAPNLFVAEQQIKKSR